MNIFTLLLCVVAIQPADRLRMADRLFNKGEYRDAKAEYNALRQLRDKKGVADDELLFRLAETDRLLGDMKSSAREYQLLVEKFPNSKYVHRSRLVRALEITDKEAKIAELKVLDKPGVDNGTRATALYHIGILTKDASTLKRAIEIDPKGKYADHASFQRAAILSESSNSADIDESVNELLRIAFSGDQKFREEALYLAALKSYSMKNYSRAEPLFSRYLKTYPKGKHVENVKLANCWCSFLTGKYSAVQQLAANSEGDDFAYLYAASTYQLGSREEAYDLYAKYLDSYPTGKYRTSAELVVARRDYESARNANDFSKAIEAANKAYQISKNSADYYNLGRAYERNGQNEDASRIYSELRVKEGNNELGLNALFSKAMLDLRLEKWSAAELELAEVMAGGDVGDRKALALFWRGVAAIHLEHEESAAQYLREALELGLSLDQQREARLMLADIAHEAGRDDEAKAEYEKIIADGGVVRMSAAKAFAIGRLCGGNTAKVCAQSLISNDSPEWRQSGYVLLGLTEEAAESYTAAVEAYRNAMALPCAINEIVVASLHLGKLEMKFGEYEKAAATLTKSVNYNSENPRDRAEAYMLLAENAEKAGDMVTARGYATCVAELFPGSDFEERAKRILEKNHD